MTPPTEAAGILASIRSQLARLSPSAKIILAIIILAAVIGGSVSIFASHSPKQTSPIPPPTTGSGNGGGTTGPSTGAGICCFTVRVVEAYGDFIDCYNVTIKIDGQTILHNACADSDFPVSTPCKTSLSASVVSEQGQAVEILLFLNRRQVGLNGGNSVSAAVSYSCL